MKREKIFTKQKFENVYPLLGAVVITLITFFWLSDYAFCRSIAQKIISDDTLILFITIESALFGFLLTILALLLQINNKSTDLIKKFGRMGELVLFSKRAVYSCFAVVVAALFLLLVNSAVNVPCIQLLAEYTFFFLLVYNLLSTQRFVRIFYMLAKSN